MHAGASLLCRRTPRRFDRAGDAGTPPPGSKASPIWHQSIATAVAFAPCLRLSGGRVPTVSRHLAPGAPCRRLARRYSWRPTGPQRPSVFVTGGNTMALTRRQALKSGAAAVAVSAIAKPAIAAKDPILIGYLPARNRPVVLDRHRDYARHTACRGRDQQGRRRRRAHARADPARHAVRPDQGGERDRRTHPQPQGQHHLGTAELGRSARGRADPCAPEHDSAAFLLGRRADRREEVSAVLSQRRRPTSRSAARPTATRSRR